MKKSELKQLIREQLNNIKEEIPAKGNEPKKNLDKISDVIVQLRRIQQLTFKTKPKQAELIGKAVEILEKAQLSL